MKNDIYSLFMVVAAIAVVGLILGLFHSRQVKVHREQVRIHGLALTRALASAELPQLVSEPGKNSLAGTLVKVQGSDAFAYVAVESKSGARLFESVSAGSIVPRASMPASDPSAWFGEQALTSPGDGRNIREFFGPVLKGGELAGFVRVGYYERPRGTILAEDVSYLGLLALPVFVLTALWFFVLRREVRPLAKLGEKMDEVGKAFGADGEPVRSGREYRDFVKRFEQFMEQVQSRTRTADQQYLAAQTSTRLLTYKQEKATAILDAIPDAVLVIDGSSAPTYANPKIEPLLGVNRQSIIGEPPQKWCTNKEVLALLMRLGDQAGQGFHAGSIEYSPEEHPDRRIAVSAYPLFLPRDHTVLLGTLVVFRDISEEYRARQAGAEFVAQVAHELKTPLANIAGYSELLLDYAALQENDRVNAVNVIRDETERAVALISNLLNISKLEAGTMPIRRQRVRIADLLRDAADSLGRTAAAKGVSLELKLAPDLGSARLDKDLFRIALDNLLSNAIKYSDTGGRVTLSAENLDDLQTKISVRDEGIGISAEDLEKVFDKYYRSGTPAAATRSGHGLGLFLAKQIVELHHGTISVSSEPGKGSEFTMQFHGQTQQLQD